MLRFSRKENTGDLGKGNPRDMAEARLGCSSLRRR